MKAKDLLTVWSAPDNSRLTSKQFSFRLPVHVAAKLAALGDMYPAKSRTQIVGDLLSAALSDVESQFVRVKGTYIDHDPSLGDLYEDVGPGATFRSLANRYFRELETDLGTEKPPALYEHTFVVTESDER